MPTVAIDARAARAAQPRGPGRYARELIAALRATEATQRPQSDSALQNAPRRLNTAGTVFTRMLRSRNTDQRSR